MKNSESKLTFYIADRLNTLNPQKENDVGLDEKFNVEFRGKIAKK